MSTYTVTYGSIAAIQFVRSEGLSWTVVYVEHGEPPEYHAQGQLKPVPAGVIPREVRAIVDSNFELVFSEPLRVRSEAVSRISPITVEVEEEAA
jgi:hypothetical protein